jgi:WD40 repeat protein
MDRSQVLGLMVAQLHGWGLAEAAESLAVAVGDDTAVEPSNDLSALLSAAASMNAQQQSSMPSMAIASGPPGVGLDLDAPPSAPKAPVTYDPVFVTPTRGISSSAAFSPDGNTFVTGSEDASIKVLQLVPTPPGEPSKWILHKTLFDHTAIVNEIAFHPHGHVLASASDDGCVRFFDLAKGYQKRGFRFFQVFDATTRIYAWSTNVETI